MEIIKNRLRHFGQLQTGTDLLEESQSVIVPDTSPDVLQIVGTSGWLNIQEKNCSQNVLRIGGQVNCTVCYQPVEGKRPCTIAATVPFSYVREIDGMNSDDQLLSTVKVLHTTASMLNPRKLMIRVQLQVVYKLYKCQNMEYVEDILNGEEEGVQCLREKQQVQYVAEIIEKRLVLNDEIRLSSALPNDRSILLGRETAWINEDIKLLPGKIMLRGRVDAALATMDDQGAFIGKSKYSVPFSQIIECESVMPEDTVEISYAPVREEIELVTSSDQVTTMQFSLAAVTECQVRKNREIALVQDTFSTKWKMKVESVELASPADAAVHCVRVPVQEKITVEGEAARVLGLSVIPEAGLLQKGDPVLNCGFHVTVDYAEADGTVMTAYRKVYAEGACAQAGYGGLCTASAQDPIAAISGDGEVEIRFEAELCCTEDRGVLRRAVGACAIEPGSRKEPSAHSALIVRTAGENETVWALAKAYNTVPAVLASANKLGENEAAAPGRLILIPFVSR